MSALPTETTQRPTPCTELRSTSQETMLAGFGDNENPSDTNCEDWTLPLSDDEDKVAVPDNVARARPDRADKTSTNETRRSRLCQRPRFRRQAHGRASAETRRGCRRVS